MPGWKCCYMQGLEYQREARCFLDFSITDHLKGYNSVVLNLSTTDDAVQVFTVKVINESILDGEMVTQTCGANYWVWEEP